MSSTPSAPAEGTMTARPSPYQLGVGALVALSMFGAALSGAQPTRLPVADALWSAGLAVVAVLAATRARSWTVVWLAAAASLASVGSTPALICSLLALALSVANGTLRNPPVLLAPAAVAVGLQALLRLPQFGSFGLPSIVAAAAVAPLLASAYLGCTVLTRRRVRRLGLGAFAACIVAVGIFGVVALGARSRLDTGIAQARSGLDAIRKGDQAKATTSLNDASASFDAAHASFGAPWALAVRAVPVAAQQAEALARLADVGSDLADTGASTAGQANYRELRAAKGTVDLTTVKAMQQPVTTASSALRGASLEIDALNTGWLVPPISGPVTTLGREINAESAEAELARDVLEVAPDLLGATAPRRYVVLFTNPAESRFSGGFVGAFAELTAENGKVTLTTSTNENQFADTLEARQRAVTIPEDLSQRYQRYNPARFLQNLTVSPDFPVDAALVREVYPQVTGRQIDGVIMADPFALAGFLQLTGPVKVEGLEQPLSATNAVDYLLKGQYLEGGPNTERKERLGDSARATFDALTSRDLPGPRTIGDALGPALRDGRLQFMVFDAKANELLDRIGTIRRFDPTQGHDYVSVRTANANPNKIDTYLHRRLDYDVTYAPSTGEVHARATVTLTNSAPAIGLPPYVIGNDRQQPDGSNTTYFSLYSPLELQEATENRAPFAIESQREFGGSVYSSLVTVPAGDTRTIVFELKGSLPTGAEYHLDVLSQPMINPDGTRVVVHTAETAARIDRASGLVVTGDTATIDGDLADNRRYDVAFVAR